MKRVLETKAFARWRTLSEGALCRAASEVEAGVFEADLGKGVVKKRIAYPGRGKSGSARVLMAQRMREWIIFLVGRDKSDRSSDFSSSQEEAAKELAIAFEKLDHHRMQIAIAQGVLKEICRGKGDPDPS